MLCENAFMKTVDPCKPAQSRHGHGTVLEHAIKKDRIAMQWLKVSTEISLFRGGGKCIKNPQFTGQVLHLLTSDALEE